MPIEWSGASICKAGSLVMTALVALSPSPVRAEGFVTGNLLYEECTSERGDHSWCMGYIEGATDMILSQQYATKHKLVCIPETVNNKQIRDLVMKEMRDHPENRNALASDHVALVGMLFWPCKN